VVRADASENIKMIIVAHLNLSAVQWARAQGSVPICGTGASIFIAQRGMTEVEGGSACNSDG